MGEKIRINQRKDDGDKSHVPSGIFKSKTSAAYESPFSEILHLQRTIGNRVVTRLIQSGRIQAKLTIGQPGDIYEKEADRVAEQVMRMSGESLVNGHQSLARKEKDLVQARVNCGESSDISSCVESHINALKGKGRPLSPVTRDYFEPRFGSDFSQVRVHTGPDAAAIAREINARAFTTGRDVFFGTGQYSPTTSRGKRLMAHELTHVIQQKGSTASRIQAQDADECTYGEIRSWAIVSQSDHTAPAGLADAKASIGAVCGRGNPCACVDGSNATAPADQAAWANIVAATGGTDQTGGGNFMCVGHENCWFVHDCYECHNGSRRRVARATNLATSGTCTVTGKGTLYFYDDPLRGWCNREDYISGCRTQQQNQP